MALVAYGMAQDGLAWYPEHDPVREVTAAGTAQIKAVREAELLAGASAADARREIDAMRGAGMGASVERVRAAVVALDTALMYHGLLEEAAKAGAKKCAIGDPHRAGAIVAAQWDLVRSAGPGAIMAARRAVARTRAFNAMMVEWANAAGVYGRDGSAAEAAAAAEAKKFSRRGDDQFGFTGMSVNLKLRQHEKNQVKMTIRRNAILSSVYHVEYYAFRARLSNDHEEIDSPKVAWNAHECEVRLPDGALVNPGGISVVARRSMMDTAALGHLGRLEALGVGVATDEGL